MKSIKKFLGGLLLIAAAGLLLSSCDDREEAAIPAELYTLKATYTTGSLIRDIDVDDHYVAIAAGGYGMQLLDFSTIGSPSIVAEYRTETGASSSLIALSKDAGVFATLFQGSDFPWGSSVIVDYVNQDTVGSLGFGYPLSDLRVQRTEDPLSIRFWGADRVGNDGLVASRYCWDDENMRWSFLNCPLNSTGYVPPRDNMQSFSIRDSLFAIAIEDDGVHFHNPFDASAAADVLTPGNARDCQWYGDYVLVADRYFLTVVDASSPLEPVVHSNFIIDGADRLQSVKADGDLAFLMDENDGVYILDITDLSAPELVQEIRMPEPTAIDVDHSRLYITDEQMGLLVYTRD